MGVVRAMGDSRSGRLGLVLAAALVIAATFSSAAPVAAASAIRVPVLMYHRFAQEAPAGTRFPDLYVTPSAFDAQLSALNARGWHTITAAALGEAIRARTALPARTFVISVDDGHVNGYTIAWPIMQRYGFVGTFYVVTGHMGDPGFLTWDMAAALAAAGNEIANHTVSHVSLPSFHGAALAAQIDDAGSAIQTQLALRGVTTTVQTFAYPYGHTSPEATRLLAARGYTLAVTTVFGDVPISSAEPLLYPRVRVSRGESVQTVLATLGGVRLTERLGQGASGPAGSRTPSGAPSSEAGASPAPSVTTPAAALTTASPSLDLDDPAALTVAEDPAPGNLAASSATAGALGIGGLGLLTGLVLTSALILRRRRQ